MSEKPWLMPATLGSAGAIIGCLLGYGNSGGDFPLWLFYGVAIFPYPFFYCIDKIIKWRRHRKEEKKK